MNIDWLKKKFRKKKEERYLEKAQYYALISLGYWNKADAQEDFAITIIGKTASVRLTK